MDWKDTLEHIRHAKLELASLDRNAGAAIAPREGASLRAISLTERRMGKRLPRPYRAFLHQHDGWQLFFDGANLLGTHELALPNVADLSRSVFEAYETPIPEVGPSCRPDGRPDAMIPFGLDREATTLFAFNPAVVHPDGDMEVIAWVNGLGERFHGFGEFLTMVREALEADVAEQRELARRSA